MPYDPLVLNAGELRHTIVIQQATSTRDAAGQPVSSWANVLTTQAKIEGTTSYTYKDLVQSGAITSQATDVMTIRWPGPTPVINETMQVLFQDNTYKITAVDNVLRRNRVLKLICIVIDGDSD